MLSALQAERRFLVCFTLADRARRRLVRRWRRYSIFRVLAAVPMAKVMAIALAEPPLPASVPVPHLRLITLCHIYLRFCHGGSSRHVISTIFFCEMLALLDITDTDTDSVTHGLLLKLPFRGGGL